MALTCAWFALCDRPADYTVSHPILGEVPTCRRCVDKLDLHDRAAPIIRVRTSS